MAFTYYKADVQLEEKYARYRYKVFQEMDNSECDKLRYKSLRAFENWIEDPCNVELLELRNQAKAEWYKSLDERSK